MGLSNVDKFKSDCVSGSKRTMKNERGPIMKKMNHVLELEINPFSHYYKIKVGE